MKILTTLLPALLAAAGFISPLKAKDTGRVIVAYVTSWSDVTPDPHSMTHINYAFGHVNNTFDGVRIDNPDRLRAISGLKQQNPKLKVLLSVGGWGSGRFSEMAATDSTRRAFAADCRAKIKEYGLDGIQLHGHESPELCDLLRQKGLMVIKAFAIKDEDSLAAVYRYEPHCDYFLFDTPCSGYGGSGKQFDWSCLQHYEKNTPFILSGGINPASISQLKRFHHSRWAGIDLNSGFELSPGYKDPKRVKEFIEEMKNIAL